MDIIQLCLALNPKNVNSDNLFRIRIMQAFC